MPSKGDRLLSALIPVTLGLILLEALDASAQERGGILRHRADQRGDLTIAANNILSCRAGTSSGGTSCEEARRRDPITQNNDYTMEWIDADNDASTFNSSGARLTIPEGARVTWARLYWMSAIGKGTSPPRPNQRGTVRFKVPGVDYVSLTADQLDVGVNDAAHGELYLASVDVTSLVAGTGSGTYFVADIQCSRGANNLFGGWSLLTAYESDTGPMRSIAVFDAYQHYSTDPTAFEVSGFFTPRTGTVRSRVAVMLGDGDADQTDVLRITAEGRTTELGGGLNPSDDIANSTITLLGQNAPGRVPADVNTFGFDSDLIDTTSALPNGASKAIVSARTDREIVLVGVVAFSTDLLAPILATTKSWVDPNGEVVRAGDEIEYVLATTNVGEVGAIEAALHDTVPELMDYVPGSITVDGRALTDAADGDEGEYDPTTRTITVRPAKSPIPVGQGFNVRFRARIHADVRSGTVILNQADVQYAHEVLGPTSRYKRLSDGKPRINGEQPTELWPVDQLPFPEIEFTKGVAAPWGEDHREALVGDEVTWTIEVSNAPPCRPAEDVVITDAIDPSLEIVSVTSDRGTPVVSGHDVSLPIGALEGGGKVTLTIVTRTGRSAAIENQAAFKASNTEDRITDDLATPELDDPTRIVVGGFAGDGCGCGTGGLSLLPLLALLALVARRRSARALLLVLATTSIAHAQAGFSLDRHFAGPLPEDGFGLADAAVPMPRRWAFALGLDYSHDPLVLERLFGDATSQTTHLVRHQLVGRLDASYAFEHRITAFAQVPMNLVLAGDAKEGLFNADGLSAGDPRIGVRWVLRDRSVLGVTDGLGIAVQGSFTLPLASLTTDALRFAGDHGPTATPLALFTYRKGPFRGIVNAGARFRRDATLANLQLGSEWLLGAGVAVSPDDAGKLTLHAEWQGATSFAQFLRREESASELIFGLKYRFSDAWTAGLAAGPGLTHGAGTPDGRGLFTVAYSPVPPPPDTDLDGIIDASDRCVEIPEDKDGFEDIDGCPEPDNDRDRILDADDKCPLDPEDHDAFEDADGCPDPDNDRDYLPDRVDACPDEAEDADSFQDADGCPDPDNDQDKLLDAADTCPLEPEDKDGFEDQDGCPDPDNDQDNVLDAADACVNVPGAPENKGCPWADTDGDGLFDDVDACVHEPGPIELSGCPDRDQDQVPDPSDECPDVPGEAEFKGCPRPVASLVANKIELTDSVHFESDKDVIREESFELLLKVAQVMQAHPEAKAIRVEGHTDYTGTRTHNLDLSQRRAASVVRFLIERGGVDGARLTPKGFGFDRPIDPRRRSEEAKAKNRRVEFVVEE